ncbi:hypothetical protein LAM22_20845, partial [Mycobacterium tuberculosis]|nr:hypothetical protein [Mycobacterium tuberculosis]
MTSAGPLRERVGREVRSRRFVVAGGCCAAAVARSRRRGGLACRALRHDDAAQVRGVVVRQRVRRSRTE